VEGTIRVNSFVDLIVAFPLFAALTVGTQMDKNLHAALRLSVARSGLENGMADGRSFTT
jgi:hypothetical protein